MCQYQAIGFVSSRGIDTSPVAFVVSVFLVTADAIEEKLEALPWAIYSTSHE